MRLKRIWKVVIGIVLTIVIVVILGISFYKYELTAVDKSSKTDVIITIESGTSTKDIAKKLENAGLIRNDKVFMVYLKLNNVTNLQASTYKLNRSMSAKEIAKTISSGKGYNPNEIAITFKEGNNIREIATLISKNTNNSYDDVLKKVNDSKYLDSLIQKYWFLDTSIKNSKIYYKLEGYLFPDTYIFSGKDVTIEEIFEKMLNKMDIVLTKYKSDIKKSKYSIHEIITLASLVEKEGKTKDFNNIASVFFNRLEKGIALGSCASAYYGMGVDFTEVGIATSEMINAKNNYNTYQIKTLPVGAISSVSEDAIKVILNPVKTDYLYFLSDNEGNTYFFKTYEEHQRKQKELKEAGKWLR